MPLVLGSPPGCGVGGAPRSQHRPGRTSAPAPPPRHSPFPASDLELVAIPACVSQPRGPSLSTSLSSLIGIPPPRAAPSSSSPARGSAAPPPRDSGRRSQAGSAEGAPELLTHRIPERARAQPGTPRHVTARAGAPRGNGFCLGPGGGLAGPRQQPPGHVTEVREPRPSPNSAPTHHALPGGRGPSRPVARPPRDPGHEAQTSRSRFRSRLFPDGRGGVAPRLPAPPGAGNNGPRPLSLPGGSPEIVRGTGPISRPGSRAPQGAPALCYGLRALMNGCGRGLGGGGRGEAPAPPPLRSPWAPGRRGRGERRARPPRGAVPRRLSLARTRGRLGAPRAAIGRRGAGGVSSEWEGAAAPPPGTLIHYNFFFLLLSPPDPRSGGGGCC